MNNITQIKEQLKALAPAVTEAFASPLGSIESARTIANFFSIATPEVILQLVDESDQRNALAAENATARNAVQAFCDVVGANTDAICEEVGKEGVKVILAAMSATGSLPTTDVFVAQVGASAIKAALDDCSEFLDRDCIMDTNGISYEDAALREEGAMALHNALLRQGTAL